MFAVYIFVITAGITYSIVIGLLHH
jgi:hypothetical protein